MKKRGFTLAEVLIAMALIGVISALTLPTFISNSRNRANAAKLSSTVNSVETAFQTMMASQAEDDFSQTSFGQNRDDASLGEFLKLNGDADSLQDIGYNDMPFTQISNEGFNPGVSQVFITKNGAVLVLNVSPQNLDADTVRRLGGSVTSSMGELFIDVNGSALPNKVGRDVFCFRIGDDGMLYPAGSLNYSILATSTDENLWNADGGNMRCDNGVFSVGCTARLIEKNYEVDY